MTIGLIGRKSGMTRLFNEDGNTIPITVLEVEPNVITQLKTNAIDGYVAIQVTTGKKKATRVTKAQAGHFAKANVESGRGLWEFRLNGDEKYEFELKPGSAIPLSLFKEGQMIDVHGTSIGKGYAGVIKRHHFSSQDATHGNSLSHRAPGSIGQRQSPGKVFKGKRMAGHLGCDSRTIQNLEIVKIDFERNLLLVKGAVPGAAGSDVIVLPACKSQPAKGDK